MPELVIHGAAIVVGRWGDAPVPGGWVAVSGGRVEAIGRGVPPRGETALDATGGLVIPGMVATHHHLFQGASRGIATPPGLLDWLLVHYRAWARLTEADVEAAATASLALLALGGCTTVAAFEYLHPEDEDLVTPVIRAARRVGLRLLYVRGCAPRLEGALAERLAADGVDVTRLVEPEDRALRRTAETLARPTDGHLRFACGPTTPLLDDDGAFHRALRALADERDVPMHAHVHPLPGSLGPGEDVTAWLARIGLDRTGSWFAHGSRLTTADVAALGARGIGVAHAPSCSHLLGYPIPPLAAWRAVNERVSISVDGGASDDRGSMLLEAQLAWAMQRAVHGPAGAIDAATAMSLATEDAARTIGWEGLGRLEPGGPADLLVVDLASLEASGIPVVARSDPATLLMRTHAGGRVRHLLVGDRVVVRDGVLTGVVEREVATSANAAANRLYTSGTPIRGGSRPPPTR